MNIGLDYDDTYTRDPKSWDMFIFIMRQAGHNVYIVTWRDEEEGKAVHQELAHKTDGIYCTDRKAKAKFMFDQGICIDVWIDDNPSAILKSMAPYSGSTWE